MDFSSATEARLREIDQILAKGGVRRVGRNRPPSPPLQRATGVPQGRAKQEQAGRIEVFRVPGWSRAGKRARSGETSLGWLVHGFSTRTGGLTRVYRPGEKQGGDLNLGFTTHDGRETVIANRRVFLQAVWGDGDLPPLVTLQQVHSSLVRRVPRGGALDGFEGESSRLATLKGDGLMTDRPGVLLGIQTADCLPILVADRRTHAIAAFHAGWRGTLQRIVEGGVGRMRLEFGSRPEDLIAAIGPGIGPCCYGVGEEVRHEFESQFDYAPELFREVYDSDRIKEKYPLLFMTARAPGHSDLGPKLHLDLAEANRRQLLSAGVRSPAIYMAGLCTSCHTGRFFSHRGEHGFTGRMMSVVGIRN